MKLFYLCGNLHAAQKQVVVWDIKTFPSGKKQMGNSFLFVYLSMSAICIFRSENPYHQYSLLTRFQQQDKPNFVWYVNTNTNEDLAYKFEITFDCFIVETPCTHSEKFTLVLKEYHAFDTRDCNISQGIMHGHEPTHKGRVTQTLRKGKHKYLKQYA